MVGSTEGYRDRRRCSRDTYPEPYITKYTSIRRLADGVFAAVSGWGAAGDESLPVSAVMFETKCVMIFVEMC